MSHTPTSGGRLPMGLAVVLQMLDELDAARARAHNADPNEFTVGERLDFHKGVDNATANRYPVIAHACREMAAELARRPTPEAVAEQLRGLLLDYSGLVTPETAYFRGVNAERGHICKAIRALAATLCPGISLD